MDIVLDFFLLYILKSVCNFYINLINLHKVLVLYVLKPVYLLGICVNFYKLDFINLII